MREALNPACSISDTKMISNQKLMCLINSLAPESMQLEVQCYCVTKMKHPSGGEEAAVAFPPCLLQQHAKQQRSEGESWPHEKYHPDKGRIC